MEENENVKEHDSDVKDDEYYRKMSIENLKKSKERAISLCKGLYGKSEDMYVSRAWECGDGWNDTIAKLSYDLEFLNMTECKDFGVRIISEQVKEKFGTLRFYYGIPHIYSKWTKILSFPFTFAKKFLEKHVKFEYRYENFRKIPKNHIILHSLKEFFGKIAKFLDLSPLVLSARNEDRDEVFMEHLENKINDLISKAEKECMDRCEICGTWIGENPVSPKCVTKGWIRYVCKDCAERKGWSYEEMKNG